MKNTIKTNMLKTVSISLSILSAQILFAQADNRLKATNQVTGCRLKDRLKAGGYRLEEKKNQNKNYKLQIADNRKTESSEYQTNQGGEIATNYELRTTNYNNQGEDLDCYLMMDPEEISLAEDILGFSSGKTIPSTITTLTIFKGGTSAGQKNSVSTAIEGERGVEECSAKSQSSHIPSIHLNPTFAIGDGDLSQYTRPQTSFQKPSCTKGTPRFLENNFETKSLRNLIHPNCESRVNCGTRVREGELLTPQTVQENIARVTVQIKEAKKASRSKLWGHHFWRPMIPKLEQARDNWNKVSEALAQGKGEKSVRWKQAAEESEAAAVGRRETVEARLSGEQKGCQSLEDSDRNDCLSDISTWSLKAEEALEKADLIKNEEKDFWKDLSEQYKIAASYQKKALEGSFFSVYGAPSSDWSIAGTLAHSSTDYQVKAFEAQKQGKEQLSRGYKEVAETLHLAAEYYKLYAEDIAEGKARGYHTHWHLKGQSLQLKADYQAKAAEAQEAGQVQLAAGYKEAVATLEKAADCYERASQSYIAGKENDVTNWEKAKSSLEIVANYQVKACEAEQVGKIILAARYREQAARAQREADQYQQSIQGNIVSQESEHINPESIPNQQRQQRIDNSTKRKALSVCCEKWLAETGSVDGVSYVSNCITHVANRGLVRAFEKYRSNVIKAHNVGDDALALSWIQVAEDIQQAIEISIKKAEAFRNLELYCYPQSVYDAFRAKEAHFMTLYGIDQALENACNAMKEIAEYREEYIKTSILPQTPANIPPDMKEKKKIIEKLEFVAKYLRKAAEAYSLGKEQEYNCFKSVAECMEESINGSKAAVRAKEENDEEENDGELEALWLRTANQYEEIAKYYDQAVDVWSGGNTTECSYIDRIKEFIKEAYLNNIPNFLQPKLKDERYMFRFITDNNADRLHRAARALKKSLLDSGSDEAEISAFWRRVAEQYQLIVELNIQATQEEIKGNKAAATRLKEAANVTEDAVISAEETIDYWLGDGPPISLYGSLLLNSLPKQNNYL